MQKFYFQAVTKEGKEISGYISASTEEAAHDKLSSGGMSVLTLEVYSAEQHHKDGVEVFSFEASNREGKHIRGTIEGESKYAAYRKLRLEYDFEVSYLIPDNLPANQKEVLKVQPMEDDLVERLDAELALKKKQEDKKPGKHHDDEAEMAALTESNKMKMDFMQEQIDSILNDIVPLLQESADYIDPVKKREIEERIDLLSRLRRSNSVDHLKNLTTRLLKEISSDEIYLKGANLPASLKAEIEKRRSKFQTLAGGFDKAIGKGLYELQLKIAAMSAKKMKRNFLKLHLFTNILKTFYLSFIFLFSLCFVFWAWVFVNSLLESRLGEVEFFLHSGKMWYLTGTSFFWMIFFSILLLSKIERFFTRIYTLVGGGLLFFLYTLEFPVIAFWL